MNESNAQECMNTIAEEVCGPDYYIVDPVRNFQANILMVEDILNQFKIRVSNEEIELLYDQADYCIGNNKSNAQECLNFLVDKILGSDWYVSECVDVKTVNDIIVDNIIYEYERKTPLMQKLYNWIISKLT